MARKLRRINEESLVGGVCGGLAYYLGMPTWIIRMAWFSSVIFYGFGGVAYIMLWMFLPEWNVTPRDYDKVTGD